MEKDVKCPLCHKKVATYDGKGEIAIRVLCKDCDRHVIYNPWTKETKTAKKLERNTSSGVTFY